MERKQWTGGTQNGILKQRITTFYITEFSDEINEADLWKAFIKKGKVIDVYIAKKKNKIGKTFGFVRFMDIENLGFFLRAIRDTEVNGGRIIISVARFERKFQAKAGGASGIVELSAKSITEHKGATSNVHRRSFAEVVRGSQSPVTVRLESSPVILEWAKSNLIGRVESVEKLWNIEDLKNVDGCSDIMFRYIGGLYVLMEMENEAVAKDFLVNSTEIWNTWFVELSPFNKEFVVPKRLAVIKIYGLPPLGWNSVAFNEIAKVFGDVVVSDDCAIETRNWEVGKVVILTKEVTRIEQMIKVALDDKELHIRVWEDLVESARLIPSSSTHSDEDHVSDFVSEIPSNDDDSECDSFPEEELGEYSPEKYSGREDIRKPSSFPIEESGDNSKIGDNEAFQVSKEHVQKEINIGDNEVFHVSNEHGHTKNNMGGKSKSFENISGTHNLELESEEENLDGGHKNLDSVDFTSPINLGFSFKSKRKQKLKNFGNGPLTVNKRKSGISSRAGIDLNKIAGSHFSHMISNSYKSGSLSKNVGKNHTNNSSSDDSSQVAPNLVNPIIDQEIEAEEQLTGRTQNKEIQEETTATINIGKLLGFQLDNHHELVESLIRGEKAQANNH